MARQRSGGKRLVTPDGTRVIGKAANGDGTVFFDTSSGRWRARWTDATGRRRTVTATTRTEVLARRRGAAEVAPTTTTVTDVATQWLHTIAPTVRPGTHASYRDDVTRITARIGDLPIDQLDRATVRTLIADMHATSHAVGTIRNTRARLRQIADAAVEAGFIPANPVTGTRLPTDPGRHRRVLTLDEQRALLAALDPARIYDAAVALLYTAGVRVSETLGLAWEDVDLAAATAHVTRACTQLPGVGPVLDRPKTMRTAGVIHLTPLAVRILTAHRDHQDARRVDTWPTVTYRGQTIHPVILDRSGGLARQQAVYRAARRACDRAGVDPTHVGTHTGRRTVVTNLWTSGVDLDDVAGHVGHSSTATTARYIHDLGSRPAEVARRAAELFDPQP